MLSFTKAAEELSITQSAVSHQIRELSLRCGFALFERQGNALVLSEKGQDFADTVSHSIAALDDKLQALQRDLDRSVISIYCEPVLANKWLLPRLDRLEAQCLEMTLRLVSAGEIHDADLVIGFEELAHRNVVVVPNEVRLPVCSPDIVSVGASRLSLVDYASETAISLGDFGLETLFGCSWSSWQARFGQDASPTADKETYATVELALQAAVHGRGIVVLRRSVADDDLRAGRLIAASDQRMPVTKPIHLSVKPDSSNVAICLHLRDWLLGQMKAMSRY